MSGYPHYNGLPPHSDPDTSKEAAEGILPHVSRLAGEVLEVIKHEGGATCWEIEQRLGMSHQTASARLRELVIAEVIENSKTYRVTGSGRRAAVWVLRERKTKQMEFQI